VVFRFLNPRGWSLARQMLALEALVVAVVVVAGVIVAYVQAGRTNYDTARQKALVVAWSVAAAPTVQEAIRQPNPTLALQPFADQVQRDTGIDFVVVMSTTGVRYTHPNPNEIGRVFIGHIDPAVHGTPLTETYTGTLGPSVRAVVPVVDGGQVRALVAVGIKLDTVDKTFRQQVPPLLAAGVVALLLASIGSWLVSRRLRRQTHGMGTAELSRLYEFYDAVLHAVREGLLLLDRNGRLQLANDEARELLNLPDDAVGRRVDELGLPPALGAALAEGVGRSDEIHLTGERILVINQAPARWREQLLGTVVTLRDHTELRALTGELDSVRGFAESLRSQAHEAANRLHTVVSLIELNRPAQALEFATAELAVVQELTDRVVGAVGEPVLAALLLGKAAQANERGVQLIVDERISVPGGVVEARDLVTIVGNLLDNAVDAAVAAPPPRWVEMSAEVHSDDNGRHELVLRVADSGSGLDAADVERAFQRGWSTKTDDRLIGRGLGLALVGQAVYRHGGTIEVSRERGAVFMVRLPIDVSDRPEHEQPLIEGGVAGAGAGSR
jgi:two-component system, CitB family, sensor kinase